MSVQIVHKSAGWHFDAFNSTQECFYKLKSHSSI